MEAIETNHWKDAQSVKLASEFSNGKKRKKVDNPNCSGCNNVISDKYLFALNDTFWHKSCAICSICNSVLEESCFMLSDNKLFCRIHYYKSSFATKCSGCNLPMQTHEVAMHALNRVYHVTCFACSCCKQLLQRGDEFILHGPDSLLVCRADYESGAYLHCSSNSGTDSDQSFSHKDSGDPMMNDLQMPYQYPDERGSKKHNAIGGSNSINNNNKAYNFFSSYNSKSSSSSKRPRTTLTIDQKKRLVVFFKTCQNPSYKQREALAEEMKLPLKVVQVWFQNQRAKVRQIRKLSSQIGCSNSVEDESAGINPDDHTDRNLVFREKAVKKECVGEQGYAMENHSDIDYNCNCDQEKVNCPISQSTEDHKSPEDLSDCQNSSYTPQDDTWNCNNRQRTYQPHDSASASDLSSKSINYLSSLSEPWLDSSNSHIKYS